ncbi:hypothetical protein ABT332_13275 [Saccharomonospora azurea]|uniref:hypothetical protein n=1 Tax=Saccharomonospora azurea TaxID=40988 RepID=UPI00331BB81A
MTLKRGMRGAAPRLQYVPLVAAALIAGGTVAACSTPAAEYGGYCVDEATQQRVSDDKCGKPSSTGGSGNSGFFYMWMLTNSNSPVPAIGQRADYSTGKRSLPHGALAATGLPKQGGSSMSSIARGGFGAKANVNVGSSGS